jgi:uncharacterized membrane protein
MSKAILIAAVAALVFTPAVAQGQEALAGWQGLQPSALNTVFVTDQAGRQTEGKLLRLDADSLVMLVDGMEQSFEKDRVMRIEKRGDSLKNGALIGATAGILMGLMTAGISDCSGDDPGGPCTGQKVGLFFFSMGIYTAIGTAVDAMIVGRTRVFDAGRDGVAIRGIATGPRLAVRVSW